MWDIQPSRANPYTLVWTRLVPDARRMERALHRRFAAARDHGEWFRLTPEDVESVVTMTDDELAGLLPLADPETARVRLDIPKDDHAELRILAAMSGVSMARYCEWLVSAAIRSGRLLDPPPPEPKKRKGK